MFELLRRDCTGRLGRLHTPHGTVTTPALLPVVNPHKLTIAPEDMASRFGIEMLITNAYILMRDDDLRERSLQEGVHKLLDFDGSVMTDSGTFQSHVYGSVEATNEGVVAFQRDIGVDVGTALDVFTEPWDGEDLAKEAMEETLRRVEEAVALRGDMALAATVQGGQFVKLREEMASRLGSLDAQVHPVGGVVPLLENYQYRDLVRGVLAAKRGLPPGRPVHLFGAGHPMVFALAVLMGCDMFDSSSYAKYAADGRLMYVDGTRHLKDVEDSPCGCPVCRAYDGPSLRELPDADRERLLAEHNLHACLDELKVVRAAIREETLWDLVDRRSRAHPDLFEGYRELTAHAGELEPYESASKHSPLFVTDHLSLQRPIVLRYARRIFARYSPPGNKVLIGLEGGVRPFAKGHASTIKKVRDVADAHFVVTTVQGPLPIELDEMYPAAQTVEAAPWDEETKRRVITLMEHHAHNLDVGLAVMWDGDETLEMLKGLSPPAGRWDLEELRVRAVADMQFGAQAADALLDGKVKLVTSRRTGKLRNVIVDGEHVLSMRAHDGMFTLKVPGARRLHRAWEAPRLRVEVDEEAVAFVGEGKSVFAQFVKGVDEELRPGDEALVVGPGDELIAMGRTILNPREMLSFQRGVAVKIRETALED
jgi:7-cyano-7-deazaguanine tRNA-ribosyltransferase